MSLPTFIITYEILLYGTYIAGIIIAIFLVQKVEKDYFSEHYMKMDIFMKLGWIASSWGTVVLYIVLSIIELLNKHNTKVNK